MSSPRPLHYEALEATATALDNPRALHLTHHALCLTQQLRTVTASLEDHRHTPAALAWLRSGAPLAAPPMVNLDVTVEQPDRSPLLIRGGLCPNHDRSGYCWPPATQAELAAVPGPDPVPRPGP